MKNRKSSFGISVSNYIVPIKNVARQILKSFLGTFRQAQSLKFGVSELDVVTVYKTL